MKPTFLAAAAFGAAIALSGASFAQPAGGAGGAGGVRQACAADIQKVCPDAKPGRGGGLRECIRSHWNDLSKPCQDAIAQMRAAHQQQGGGGPGGGGH